MRLVYSQYCLRHFQSELTSKGHEVITLKSEVRDLLQKLESKERHIHKLEETRPERYDEVDSSCNDRLTADNLYSVIGRLNEQVIYF